MIDTGATAFFRQTEAMASKGFQPPEHWVYWHGTPSGDLRGGEYGLHVGTHEAARQAMTARIGHPVEGTWDGTKKYGETLLAGKKTLRERGVHPTGYSSQHAPEEDHYPTGKAAYGDGTPVPADAKPNIVPVRIRGEMSNHPTAPHDDFKANGLMKGQIKRGNAKRGYFYRNEGEDEGSISAVVPGEDHVERLPQHEIEPGARFYQPEEKRTATAFFREMHDAPEGEGHGRAAHDTARTAGRGKPRHQPGAGQDAAGTDQDAAGAAPAVGSDQGRDGAVGPREVSFHPAAKKEIGKLDGDSQKRVAATIDGLASGDDSQQTHALNGLLKGWRATKATRGHRVVHRDLDDGTLHIGYVGLHDYDRAINRLATEFFRTANDEASHQTTGHYEAEDAARAEGYEQTRYSHIKEAQQHADIICDREKLPRVNVRISRYSDQSMAEYTTADPGLKSVRGRMPQITMGRETLHEGALIHEIAHHKHFTQVSPSGEINDDVIHAYNDGDPDGHGGTFQTHYHQLISDHHTSGKEFADAVREHALERGAWKTAAAHGVSRNAHGGLTVTCRHATPTGDTAFSATAHFRQTAGVDDDDYRLQHQAPDRDGIPLHDLVKGGEGVPEDVYTHPHYYSDMSEPSNQDAHAAIRKARGNPDAKIHVFRSLPAEHANKGFRPGDWVSTSKAYARDHGRQTDPKDDWPVIRATVRAGDLHTHADDFREWGYNGDKPKMGMIAHKGGYNQEVRYANDDVASIVPVKRRAPKEAAGSDDYRMQHRAPGPHESNARWDQHTGTHEDDHVQIYRSVPHGTHDIHPGDWISVNSEYAHQHGRHNTDPNKDEPVLTASVPAKHIWTDHNDENEQGYSGPAIRQADFHHPDLGIVSHRDARALEDEHKAQGINLLSPGRAPEQHTGAAVHLTPEDHAFVHDKTKPIAQRAQRLHDNVPFKAHAFNEDHADFEDAARDADGDAMGLHEQAAHPHMPTHVVLHGREGQDHHGISWAEGVSNFNEEEPDPADFERHDFHQQHTAATAADPSGGEGQRNPAETVRMVPPEEYRKFRFPDYPQAKTLPALVRHFKKSAPDYYAKVRNDVQKNGFTTPILVRYKDQRGNPLASPHVQEGHHRAAIAHDLGLHLPVGDYDNEADFQRSRQGNAQWFQTNERPAQGISWNTDSDDGEPEKRLAGTATAFFAEAAAVDHSDGVMVAFVPPREIAEQLVQEGGQPVEDLHITLAYLGDASDYTPEQLAILPQVISSWAVRQKPVSIRIGGVTKFNNAFKDQHVLCASADIPGGAQLHADLARYLEGHGFRLPSEHGWTPHLTLAYVDKHFRFLPHVDEHSWSAQSVVTYAGPARHEALLGVNTGGTATL